jgi:hypothetical protein
VSKIWEFQKVDSWQEFEELAKMNKDPTPVYVWTKGTETQVFPYISRSQKRRSLRREILFLAKALGGSDEIWCD